MLRLLLGLGVKGSVEISVRALKYARNMVLANEYHLEPAPMFFFSFLAKNKM